MIPKELISQIRKIEIKSKKLVDSLFAGNFRSAFKGRGLEFEGIRQYIRGDDYRNIDWKVTARMNKPFIKIYREERELVVMLVIDVSASAAFGSLGQTKRELAAEFCATIALSAVSSGDSVGLLMFSDRIEKFIPPKKGKTHALRLIREILFFRPAARRTKMYDALSFLNRAIKHRCIAFVVSDFEGIDARDEKMLSVTNLRHDAISIILNDELDVINEDVGLVDIYDLETGEALTVDTSDKKTRGKLMEEWQKRRDNLKRMLRKCNIDFMHLSTGHPIQKPMMEFFRRRETVGGKQATR